MKISYNWLTQYIKIDYKPDELSEILTNLGLEVSSIEDFSSVKGGLKGVVIGKVEECTKHPDADKLSLTKVNIGNPGLLSIVCGAPNVKQGQKVVVATVGTTLYADKGEFEIKKVKIRGEVSEGMICAEDEIGIGTSHEGIIVLNDDAVPGTPASEYFNIETDIVFEIDLTPNRIDAASHIGVARDIAAYINQHKDFSYTKPNISSFKTSNGNCNISIEIQNTEACQRYMGLSVNNVKVEDSPQWLQNRLKAIGINPINNIVDISNFVLHETGHPLHAFDKDMISGNKVIVKTLPEGTKFASLDDIERTLTNQDLMICNTEGGMCIAGVIGGTKSGITENTRHVFLESAYFNPEWVRKTAKHHGVSTDSSFRFERGADIDMAPVAIKQAALLIRDIAGGEIGTEIKDIYPRKIEKNKLKFSYEKCFSAIGKKIDKEIINRILKALEIEVIKKNNDNLELLIPKYRVDVIRQEDINEEILRIYGYNNIDIPEKIIMNINKKPYPDNEILVNKISNHLSGMGFKEIMCNSLIKDSYLSDEETLNAVKLHNPLSKDLSIMRNSLIYGGLESIAYNINRKKSDLKFFEFGRTYFQNTGRDKPKISDFTEKLNLGIWITGKQRQLSWNQNEENSDFFIIKGYCENIFKIFGIEPDTLEIKNSKNINFKYCSEYFLSGKEILRIGEVNRQLLHKTGIEQNVYFAEFNWDLLLNTIKDKKLIFTPISKYPQVNRDLSVLIDKNITYEQLRQCAIKTEPDYLKSIRLFDVYSGKGIENGKISYALSFTLEDNKKTMTDRQIDKIMNKIINAYTREFGAVLR